MPPEFDIWHIAIPVKNLEKSVEFYTSLGFTLTGRDEFAAKKQAFVATKPGGFNIELFEPKNSTKTPQRPDHLAFECTNISSFRKTLSPENAAHLITDIEEFDNGVKYFEIKDPDGVSVQFFEGRKIYENSIK